MIFETLGFRSKTSSTASKSQESIPAPAGPRKPNGSHSPAKSPKRHSNNLFGSNRFRDYSYMRSVAQGRNSTSTTQTHSVASEAPTHDNTISQAVSDEPSEVRSAPLIPPAPYGDQPPLSVAEYRLSQTLGASGFKRASIALDEAIREMEEEAEDEIVMPRSAPISRSSFDQPVAPVRNVRSTTCSRRSTRTHEPSSITRERQQPRLLVSPFHPTGSILWILTNDESLQSLPGLFLDIFQVCHDP